MNPILQLILGRGGIGPRTIPKILNPYKLLTPCAESNTFNASFRGISRCAQRRLKPNLGKAWLLIRPGRPQYLRTGDSRRDAMSKQMQKLLLPTRPAI